MNLFATYVTKTLLEKEFISSNQVEWCYYMIIHRTMNIVSFLILVPIGSLIVDWPSSIFFVSGYRFLRSRTGGYHAKSPMLCLILSVFLQIIILPLVNVSIPLSVLFGVLVLSLPIIIFLSPANNAEIHFTDSEIQAIKPRIIARIFIIVFLVFLFVSLNIAYYKSLILSAFITALLLIVSRLGYGAQ